MTEEVLLQGCLHKDAVAQQEFYNRYSPKMLSVCYRFAKNREDAEDMLQEGFIRIFSQIHQFQHKGALEGWIRKIVVHTCINLLKKNKKFSENVDIQYAQHLSVREEAVSAVIQAKQVIECIRMLPIGYRTVLNLFAIEGYNHKGNRGDAGHRREYEPVSVHEGQGDAGRHPHSEKDHPGAARQNREERENR